MLACPHYSALLGTIQHLCHTLLCWVVQFNISAGLCALLTGLCDAGLCTEWVVQIVGCAQFNIGRSAGPEAPGCVTAHLPKLAPHSAILPLLLLHSATLLLLPLCHTTTTTLAAQPPTHLGSLLCTGIPSITSSLQCSS